MAMSDRSWNKAVWFFLLTIIPGGLTMAYFGERDQLGMIMDNMMIKSLIILYCIAGVFIVIYSEVRKRSDASAWGKVLVTLAVMLVTFAFLAMTRL